MTLVVDRGLIAHVAYPIDSPRAHIAGVLAWLQEGSPRARQVG
jgi:hypothetical protein